MKEWYSITLFHYSSKSPIAVIEKLYTSYGLLQTGWQVPALMCSLFV